MTIPKKIGLFVIIILVFVLTAAVLQPSEYTISREMVINAPPEKIFPYLNDSKLAEQWGPWLEVDPQAKMAYSGPTQGVGSRSSWNSQGQLGVGSATIIESIPLQKVAIKLQYTEPMAMIQDSVYLIEPAGAQSKVIWKVQGKNTFPGRVMCLFMNMDKMVGGMFEKGLLNLKKLVEAKGS